MGLIDIPDSLRAYYDNDNKAVGRAVDALIGKLNGTDMPDCYWKEAQNYNQALLMTAQVRADYVALLFDLWETTFGRSGSVDLGGEYFDYEGMSPQQVWHQKGLWRDYYRDGDPDAGGPCDSLSVYLDEARLELRVYRYNENGALNGSEMTTVEGWSTQHDDDDYPCLANAGVQTQDFLFDPDSVMVRFAKDADKVIQALLDN